jgi:hypothetical protein
VGVFRFPDSPLISLFFASYFEQIATNFKTVFTICASGVLFAPLVLFVINGLLSSDVKASLIFWRISEALPGCRAFSVHAKKDYRVNVARLQTLHGVLPVIPKAQNALWYKIYKANRDDQAISSSHAKFLLARDLVAMAFLFLIFVGIPFLILGERPFNVIYLIIQLVIYLLLVIVGQNHGGRFVRNVLALESAK